MSKDIVYTVRLPVATRRRLERQAKENGRKVSDHVRFILEKALDVPRRPVPGDLDKAQGGGNVPSATV